MVTSLLMSGVGLIKGSQHPHPKTTFTAEEDSQLLALVERFGVDSWPAVSRHMPGRNSRQCRDRWMNSLSPDICKEPWSESEDALLREKIGQFGRSWKRIAAFFDRRSEVNVKSHWNRMQRRIQRGVLEKARSQLKDAQIPIVPSCPPPPLDLPHLPVAEDDLFICDVDSWYTF
jgi:hypothetical protein